MKETLYYKDNYKTDFESVVVECIEDNGVYKIVLENTAFYPEGGGQKADIGKINGILVKDVQIKDDIIYHTLEKPIAVGETVIGKVDFESRFSNMQHHTAEHIVSGLVCKEYTAENVGFHMGQDAVTMDFNVILTKEQIEKIEQKANEAVFQNIEIKINNYTKEQVKDMQYRSKKELEGIIRIVEIPGYDICACCGLHVEKTGEIGMIKLLSVEKYKSGCRVSMICGKKAIQNYNDIYNQVNSTSTLLSCKHDEVYNKVEELQEKIKQLQHQNRCLEEKIFEAEVNSLEPKKVQLLFKEALDSNEMKNLCTKLKEKSLEISAVFAKNGDNYRFQIMSDKIDLRPIAKELTTIFHGRGGGKGEYIQGQITATKEEIEKYFLRLILFFYDIKCSIIVSDKTKGELQWILIQ